MDYNLIRVEKALESIAKSLEKMANPLHEVVSSGKSVASSDPRITPTDLSFLQHEGSSLAKTFGEAVAIEFSLGNHDVVKTSEQVERIKKVSTEVAEKAFANAQDTSEKLARAYGELSELRHGAHKARLEGMQAVYKLVAQARPERGDVITESHHRMIKALDAAWELIKLNQPRSEEV